MEPSGASDLLPVEWQGNGAPPLEIDVGCHKGLFLVEMAGTHPERNFLGIELQSDRVEKTRKKIRNMGLSNAVVMRSEGLAAVLALPEDCAEYIHVLFPDPWPKRRHHIRRLVEKRFLQACHRVLKPSGVLRLVTDHEEYAGWMVEMADASPAFVRAEAENRIYPQTEFQKKFVADARPVHTLVLRAKAG
jgi:tRNA (guanine-N7-)-methyltransferase